MNADPRRDTSGAPRLAEVGGERIYPLRRKLILVGSSPLCNVQIPDKGIREQHLYLLERDGRWFVKPIDDRSRCRLNGLELAAESELEEGGTLELPGSLSLRFHSGGTGPQMTDSVSMLREHAAFLQLFADVLRARDLRSALDRMAARIAGILECDGAALIEWSPGSEVRLLAAYPADSRPGNFSRNCLLRTWDHNAALALKPFDTTPSPSESIAINQVGSVLCAPLAETDAEGLRFFLYLDRFTGRPAFTKEEVGFFESIRELLGGILSNARLKQAQAERIARIQENRGEVAGMVFQSEAMLRILAQARKVAAIGAPILVQGETGTGKELLARQIHAWSPRCKAPFHAINCGAISPNLLESELFGHEKGSFTGAHARRVGWIEQADGGTLFLDEIGDLDLGLQVKLLRVVQEGEFCRVGGTETLRSDFRLVTATHRDLEAMVEQRTFREDLYYRVNVVRLVLPPLRERPDDILLLSTHFLRKHSERFGLVAPQIGHKAERWLVSQAWSGNVRQLENVLQKAVILCEGPTLLPEHLDSRLSGSRPHDALPDTRSLLPSLDDARSAAEREICTTALDRSRGNVVKAAELLSTDRRTLQRVLDRIGLDASRFRSKPG